MRRMLATAVIVATVLLAGCNSDDTTGATPSSVAGTWNLPRSIRLQLPYTIQPTPKIEVMGDQLVVAASGSFIESRPTSNHQWWNGHHADHLRRRHIFAERHRPPPSLLYSGITGAGTVSNGTLTVAVPGFSLESTRSNSSARP